MNFYPAQNLTKDFIQLYSKPNKKKKENLNKIEKIKEQIESTFEQFDQTLKNQQHIYQQQMLKNQKET